MSAPVDDTFGHWLAGLIDGEGCFRVHANERGGQMRTYATNFALKLRDDDAAVLRTIVETTGLGSLKPDRSRTGCSRPCLKWVVDTRGGCRELVAILDRYPLRTRKAADYAVWREAVIEWTNGARGNRWHGPRDWSHMAALKQRIEEVRRYPEGG